MALGLMKEELKNEEIERRIEAMRRIGVVAKVIGPEQARTTLLDLLRESVEDDDEVLLAMAKSLAELVDAIGGPEHAGLLLPLLASVAGCEETVVRDEAARAMKKVMADMSAEKLQRHGIPAARELSTGDWFTSRVSATALFGPLLAKIKDAEASAELRSLFGRLCRDDTPMVRRAAAGRLDEVAGAIDHTALVSELLPHFNSLIADDHDSTRLIAVGQCANVAKLLTEAECNTHMLELVKACAEDKSWRVRVNIAKDFFTLSQALGPAKTTSELLVLYIMLLQDPEAEVRAAACGSLPGYFDLVGSAKFISDVVPCMRDLSVDMALNVRVKLSVVLVDVAAKLGRQASGAHLIQAIMQCLRDEASEVRLNVLGNLRGFTDVLGIDLVLSSIVPTIISLSSDKQWRVRESVAARMPLLAEVVGTSVFESKLLALFFSYFHDSVAAVRLSACRALEGIGSAYGGAWCSSRVMPKLSSKFGAAYLQRVTVLYACESLFKSTGDMTAIHADALALAARGAKDSVSNVRYVAAKVLAAASSVVAPALIESDVKPTLSELAGDEDDDVLFTAAVALQNLTAA